LTHFWQLDDDYSDFGWSTNNNYQYITGPERVTSSLDAIINACIDFLEESKSYAVAFAQGGDFIGGANGNFVEKVKKGVFSQKVMNSFFFSVKRPVKFIGRINEDVNMYVTEGNRGKLFVTIPRLRLWQHETQSNDGGLTDIYLDLGTYVKSFYSVLYTPSCVKINQMGTTHKRMHHQVRWKNAVPKIIDQRYKKVKINATSST